MDNTIKEQLERIDNMILKQMAVDLTTGRFYEEVEDDLLEMCLVSMYSAPQIWDHRGVIRGNA